MRAEKINGASWCNGGVTEDFVRGPCLDSKATKRLMAAATAATAGAAIHRAPRLPWGGVVSVTVRRTEYGQLNRILDSAALGARNFLFPVQYNTLELRFALITGVFIDRHGESRNSESN
jgi:hypothetical protein